MAPRGEYDGEDDGEGDGESDGWPMFAPSLKGHTLSHTEILKSAHVIL